MSSPESSPATPPAAPVQKEPRVLDSSFEWKKFVHEEDFTKEGKLKI